MKFLITLALMLPVLSAHAASGCGTTRPKGEISRTLTIGGVTRQFDISVPANYNKNKKSQLVFVFHSYGGFGGSIAEAKSYGIGTAAAAEQSRAIFVYPAALEYPDAGGTGWEVAPDGYDMQFFDAMLSTLSSEYCIDTKKVFAAGFSWGADFTISLGCSRGNKLRAIAPATGSIYSQGTCTTKTPAFRITYDVADPYYSQEEIANGIELYRTRNECSTNTHQKHPSQCVAYNSCENPVIKCAYEGIGHALPPQGGQNVWNFFSSF